MRKTPILLAMALLLSLGCLGAPDGSHVQPAHEGNSSIAPSPPTAQPATSPPASSAGSSSGEAPATDSAVNASPPDKFDAVIEEVIPSEGIGLNATWGDVGPRTLASGALNLTRFEELMARNGQPLTPEELGILQNGSGERIRITRNNSLFVLDLFWAFGLVDKNPILDNGSISQDPSMVYRYASTGGWPLGNTSGGALLSSSPLIALDDAQQAAVEGIAASTYRPCCDNPTSFPDCNHGMAALGLAEWLAYQNASEAGIYDAILAADRYWFPQAYVDIAAYLEENNRSFSMADPRELLSRGFSSYSGYQEIRQKLKEQTPTVNSGGRC